MFIFLYIFLTTECTHSIHDSVDIGSTFITWCRYNSQYCFLNNRSFLHWFRWPLLHHKSLFLLKKNYRNKSIDKITFGIFKCSKWCCWNFDCYSFIKLKEFANFWLVKLKFKAYKLTGLPLYLEKFGMFNNFYMYSSKILI